MSRAKNLAKNIKWSYLGTIITMVLGFVVRTVFIYCLGKTMLGLNCLYASVIGVLSIAELGIGTILNTQMYKPVAENDENTIIAIMQLYKKIYNIIAFAILIIGLALVPVLDVLIKGAEDVEYVHLYYLLFLFNTVITYFVSYKFSISNAEQKNYINTNFDTIFTLIMYIWQIVALFIWKNFFSYLAIQFLVSLFKAIFISLYMNKKYPILRHKERVELDKEKKSEIKKNVFAGMVNKFSDSAINQTDSMIISAFVNVTSLGLVTNYTTLRNYVEKFTKPLFDNSGSIVGNFVNTESVERKRLLMKALQLYALVIYGYSSLVLFFLSTPFVKIWLGTDYIISTDIIFVICLNLMLSGVGDRPYVLFKNSHGNFYNDWHVVFSSAIVNLIVSICLVIPYGIVGVFIGTTCTILTSVFWRPFLFYKKATGEQLSKYFLRLLRNYMLVGIVAMVCYRLMNVLNYSSNISELIIKFFTVTIIYFVSMFLTFFKTEEFGYLIKLAVNILKRRE